MNALDRHRALLAQATPGPWLYDDGFTDDDERGKPRVVQAIVDGRLTIVLSPDYRTNPDETFLPSSEQADGNGYLIAAAVNMHPLLLDLWAAAKCAVIAHKEFKDSPNSELAAVYDVEMRRVDAVVAKLEALQ